MVCLSPYDFSRSFKQAAEVGPQHYVIQRRLERAKTLLRRTNQQEARMQRTEPNYSVRDLFEVHVPIAIVQREHDELIKVEHAEYLAVAFRGKNSSYCPASAISHLFKGQRNSTA
jgi:AraC-like DNA-binding protein